MDINQVLREYDQMFGRNSMDEIDEFLTNKIGEALEERDYYSALTLMNEMLGFCRDTSRREKGLHYCELVEAMFDRLRAAGCQARRFIAPEMWHAYVLYGVEEAEPDFVRIGDFVHELFEES